MSIPWQKKTPRTGDFLPRWSVIRPPKVLGGHVYNNLWVKVSSREFTITKKKVTWTRSIARNTHSASGSTASQLFGDDEYLVGKRSRSTFFFQVPLAEWEYVLLYSFLMAGNHGLSLIPFSGTILPYPPETRLVSSGYSEKLQIILCRHEQWKKVPWLFSVCRGL